MTTALLLLAGLVLLTAGAELLVRGASALAAAAHVSPLVIGLTVVAYGTSAPEMVISVQATLAGQPDLAVGNVVGSNILNVLLILGISAMIVPLVVSRQLIRFDVPVMIGVALVVWLLSLDGRLDRWDGALLVCGLVVYTVWEILQSRREEKANRNDVSAEGENGTKAATARKLAVQFLWVGLGLAMLVLGARWFTDSAVVIARVLGISKLVIGLTVVAVGTSLPEVATSIIAALRGERDIAVGNVVGSNLLNMMGVLGVASTITPEGLPVAAEALDFDIPVMVAVMVACLPIFFTGHLIARWEGALFFAYYLAYTAYVVLAATKATAIRNFEIVMLGFFIPLTVITLAVGVIRHRRRSTDG